LGFVEAVWTPANKEEDDVQALRAAVATLEHPSFAARLAELAGKPIEIFNARSAARGV